MTKRVIFFIWTIFLTLLLFPGIGHALTADEICRQKNLTPEQCQLLKARLAPTGGQVTPEAVENLRNNAEFSPFKPEDIQQGSELLEKQEALESRAGAEKAVQPVSAVPAAAPNPAVSEEGRAKSLFDRVRHTGKYQDISTDLKPFGHDFFRDGSIRVVAERKDIPVPVNYVVGPGDEVKIMLWGRVNAQHNLTVDRDGRISLPEIGPIFVAGMTFEQMSEHIITQTTQMVGANIDITMGSLKSIPVFVLGDVRRPGAYTIGSFATITDALLLAGGPNDIGSMRNVQLKRKGRLVTAFDLYNLLLKGDKSKDLILQAGDVVFVPVTGPLAGIAGNVKRPAIYEMKDRYDLEGLFELAGGIIPSADTQQIQVSRIQKNERQVVIDIDDKDLQKSRTVRLQDADLVKVFSIVDRDRNAVYLEGNIKRPGKYQFRKGMRVGDLIKSSDELLDETCFEYALIKRIVPPDRKVELVPFHLGKMLKGGDSVHDVELRPEDRVYVFSKWLFEDKPYVTVEGEIRGECRISQETMEVGGDSRVSRMDSEAKNLIAMEDDLKKEGKYALAERLKVIREALAKNQNVRVRDMIDLEEELKREKRPDLTQKIRETADALKTECRTPYQTGMRVKDAVMSAGGLTHDSYLARGEIIRVSDERVYSTIYFNVEKAMAGDPGENLPLQHRDRVIVHAVWEHTEDRSVFVEGDVKKPGSYVLTERMMVSDLIFRAGNLMDSAYPDEAELTSVVIEDGKAARLERKTISLRKALAGDPQNNVQLKNRDRLFVKRITNWDQERYVTVSGEFRFPGRYIIGKGEKLSSLIERAGGFTDKAYLRGAVFTRERVRTLQQKGMEELISRMERELLTEGAAQISTALSTEEVQARKIELEQKQKFVQSLKELKATGRMTIRLAHMRLLKGSHYDIELEEGDSLSVPEKNGVVNVLGAVMAGGSFIYDGKLGYQDYIAMTGGYSRYADENNIFVMKVDGSARKVARGLVNWNAMKSRWQFGPFEEDVKEIEPGDQIVVPEKIERIAWLREIKDITSILMQMAVTAGVAINLY